ncbi:Predicted PurR-regulated permease PerM [Tranquillimonas rosea]|uniref:Predicted PurR-regulated permease PerM n=1 Tax=Tranquillimonas rosea TaxID=641238 RepID=A0A1H9RDY3_9RHOB|nr:AI-2E family transporter [Tranquillimonas rosea]SER71091.1 Predicted PurR-regulated permease PerM [Tranquillimonas rosea]
MENDQKRSRETLAQVGITRRRLRNIERLLWGIFLLAAFTAIYFSRNMLLPLVLAILIALTLSPAVRALRRLGVPRMISAVALVASIVVGSLALGWGMSGPLTTMMEEAPTIGTRLERRLAGVSDSFQQMKEATEEVQKITDGQNEPAPGAPEPQQVELRESDLLSTAMASVAQAGSAAAIALVVSLFLLAGWDSMQLRIVNALDTFHDKRRAISIVRDIERQISRYLGAITLINAALGLCIGLAMHLLGMPSAWLWGVGAFLLNYLPYLGAVIGIAASAAVALLTFSTVGEAALVPMAYLGLTALEGQFITPMLVGRRLEMNALAVFITVLFWGWLWGIPGALMAVPFLVCLKVVCDHIEGLRVLGSFLSASDFREARVEPSRPEPH